MSPSRLSVASIVAAMLVVACAPVIGGAADQGASGATSERQAGDAAAFAEFKKQVDGYTAMRRKVSQSVPALPAQAPPDAVRAHEVALQNLIVGARPTAKEGDVFVSRVRPLLRGICLQMLSGPEGRQRLAQIREEPMQPGLRARVNERYPDQVPLSAVPYPILKALPPLPDELEYRFLGDDLVLLDIHARLIVDVMRAALPR
jgi:hypothetical protein